MNSVVRYLRRAALLRDGAGMTDGELLESYLRQRDETAFEALVRRHGPMVLGVCRRVLRNEADAEDAFQATFLVLVRKAASVVPRSLVGNWLYGVAHNTALKAKAMNSKRRAKEQRAGEMPKPEPPGEDEKQLHALLDEELRRLPEKYRVPIVLCDLEGRTVKEAARQLGWPQGTVAGRLARARARLAKRLTQRGLALSAGALAAVLAQGAASAGVPKSLVVSTIKAASSFAAGSAATAGVISTKVAALTEGVVKAMLLTKLKFGAALLAFVGLVATGAGILGRPVLSGGPAAATRTVGGADQSKEPVANQPALKKSERGIVGVVKKIDAKQNKLTFIATTNAGELFDLTYPMIKEVKAFMEDKDRKEIKLQDIKPGTKIHVYVNEEADESLGTNVMEIVVPKDEKP